VRQPAAVLGVGQTRHRSKRTDVSIAGLCREAVDRARTALGHAYGGGSQFFSMWVVSS
jgi:acetyl-CoA C-acetyltransferase